MRWDPETGKILEKRRKSRKARGVQSERPAKASARKASKKTGQRGKQALGSRKRK